MRLKSTVLIAMAVLSNFFIPRAFAQRVHYFKGTNFTAQNLIDVLEPTSGQRSIELMSRPDCKDFRKQASRGLKLVPQADIAAIAIDFNVNSSDITPDAQDTLNTLGSALGSSNLKPYCFAIEGYTDSTGSASLNQKLSEARAQSVVNYLVDHAEIEEDRMISKGFGPTHPLASNSTATGRAKNRRVEIVNLGHGDGVPD
jgi:outer membrane protein OmpA-like peptidoglycan-associated protein